MPSFYSRKATTDELKQIDVRFMQRKCFLENGFKGVISWSNKRTGEPTGNIDFQVRADEVMFSYRTRTRGQEHWQEYDITAPLTYTPCNYGNQRAWFECPNCSKRVAILYISKTIACRTCHRLNYKSQQTTKGMWQDQFKMNQIRYKLNWPVYQDVLFRTKPKNMQYRTFYRLVKEHDFYELSYLSAFGESLDRLYGRLTDLDTPLKKIPKTLGA